MSGIHFPITIYIYIYSIYSYKKRTIQWVQYNVRCSAKENSNVKVVLHSSYHIVRRSQEQRNRQEDHPCRHRGRWNSPTARTRAVFSTIPGFGIRYRVTPICLSVGTEVYHAQHICSIMKHMSSSEMPYNSTTPSRASRSSRTRSASASWSRGSSVAGWQTYISWGSVICWRLSTRARLRPRAPVTKSRVRDQMYKTFSFWAVKNAQLNFCTRLACWSMKDGVFRISGSSLVWVV